MYMIGMYSITLQSLFAFQSAVQHHVNIGRSQTIDIDLDLQQARNLAKKSLQLLLGSFLYFLLLSLSQFII